MEIICKEIIKPSSPTPNHLKTFKISMLDQLAMHTYTPIMLFYHSKLTSIDVLKKSLSQTLNKFYPFAGRLLNDGVTVDCGDQGVVFVEAKLISGLKLSDFLRKPDYEIQKLLFPQGFLWKMTSCVGYSFLAAQVTSFACGAMAITVCISHKVADGWSIRVFLSEWAAAARGGEATPPPVFLAGATPCMDLDSPVPEIIIKSTETFTRRYTFDGKKIDFLKESMKGVLENPTKVELVTALLFKCASMAKSGGGYGKSILIQLVNMRRRMAPPLPENSIGNFAWYFTISNDDNLTNLVVELRKGIKELCNSDDLDLSDWLMGVKESTKSVKKLFDNLDVYRCSSFCKGSYYEMDFGSGNPKWVSMADVSVKNTFVLFDTQDGYGVEAVVTLEGEEDIKGFEINYEDFFDLVSTN